MSENFLQNTRVIHGDNGYSANSYPTLDAVQFNGDGAQATVTPPTLTWVVTQGLDYPDSFRQVIQQNRLDEFLNVLLAREKLANKVVELDDMLFIAVKNMHADGQALAAEQVFFVVSSTFVWSVQEGKYPRLAPLTNKLNNHQKLYKKTQIAHLLFFLMSAIVDSYETAYQQLSQDDLLSPPSQKIQQVSNSHHIHLIENKKRELFALKSSLTGLRNVMTNLLRTKHPTIKSKYFSELQEQATHLIADIDFDLQELDSKLNLLLSLQSNRLNETMQVLTVISIIFLPLNLIAGIYGMNFINMPELKWHYGYFITLGVMLTLAVAITIYLKRKRWF